MLNFFIVNNSKEDIHQLIIEDISPLKKTREIVFLDLTFNHIKDFTPVKELPKLAWLSLAENPIDMDKAKYLRKERPLIYFYHLDWVRSAILCEL